MQLFCAARYSPEVSELPSLLYHPEKKKSQNLAKELVSAERVHFTAPADYSQGRAMETLAFAILKEIAARAELDHLAQLNVK